MKVSFYHIGNGWIGFKGIFDKLKIPVVKPEKITQKTLDYGTKVCPENACEPFKHIVGEYYDVLEKGADTIFLINTESEYRCRIPQFETGPKTILTKAGYKFDTFSWGGRSQKQMLEQLRKFNPRISMFKWKLAQLWGIIKLTYVEWLEDHISKLRAYALDKKEVNKLMERGLEMMDKADSFWQLKKIKKQILKFSRKIKITKKKLPVVIIIGDLYKVLQPEVNNQIFEKLGNAGIVALRSFYISHFLRAGGKIGPWGKKSLKYRKKFAHKYIANQMAPGNLESVGDTLQLLDKKKIKGIIHVYSFTCMPENVMTAIYQKISQDYKVPYLPLVTGENETTTQQNTRIEAFIDLMNRGR
jgi:predicted nucleotide-binding protein (sugar kinase/HSP70/actin superfamily)